MQENSVSKLCKTTVLMRLWHHPRDGKIVKNLPTTHLTTGPTDKDIIHLTRSQALLSLSQNDHMPSILSTTAAAQQLLHHKPDK